MRPIQLPDRVAPTLTAEAEQRIVGIVLRADPAIQGEILGSGLRRADFADEIMGGIWQTCLDLDSAGVTVSIVDVCAELDRRGRLEAYGGPRGVVTIADDCVTTVGWQSWLAMVREAGDRRRTVAVAAAVLDLARAGGCTAADLRAELLAGAESLLSRPEASGALQWFDLAAAALDTSPHEAPLVEPGLVFAGDLLVIFGPPKSQKSWLALDLCARWCLGQPWLDTLTPTRPLSIAYLQFELRRDSWRRRIEQWEMEPWEFRSMAGRFCVTDRCVPTLDDGFGPRLRRSLPEGFVPDLLVVDPLANIYGGNENDNAEMAAFLRRLRKARDAINPRAAIVLVHHTAKVGREQRADDPFSTVRGASALRGAWDAAMFIDRPHQGSEDRTVQWELRNGVEPAPLTIRLERGRYVAVDVVSRVAGQTQAAKWDAEAARKMRAILRLVDTEAAAGRAWTARALAEEASQRHGLGSVRAIKGRLSELLQKRLLMGFDGRAAGLDVPARYHGHLCSQGMLLADPTGRARAVSPRWSRDTAGEMREIIGEAPWAEFSDYYDG